jgi:hypothetical protein
MSAGITYAGEARARIARAQALDELTQARGDYARATIALRRYALALDLDRELTDEESDEASALELAQGFAHAALTRAVDRARARGILVRWHRGLIVDVSVPV